MKQNTLIELKKPETFIDDPITELVRQGARDILFKALEIEIDSFISLYADLKDDQGRQRITRNGYLPKRDIQTGVGPVPVKVPRSRDRQKDSEKIRFTSSIVPIYLKKTRSMETLIPWLYLKGISTGGSTEALSALVGRDAPGLSASTISRLKTIWEKEYQDWQNRDLSEKLYVYIGVDGVYCNVRMDDKQCILVIMGATKEGDKELLAIGADTGKDAELSFDSFINTYEAKYPKALQCLEKDRDVLLKFYDFPAEHWRHIRTSNPIESTFATVRLRTAKVRGCFSSNSVLSMAFKLCKSAEKNWIKLHHYEKLGQLIQGIKFVNGIGQERNAA